MLSLYKTFFLLFSLSISTLIKAQEPVLFPFPNQAGEWGYVDAEGQVKIPFQFAGASLFFEGRAIVALPDRHEEGSVAKIINAEGDYLFEAPMKLQSPEYLPQQDYRYSESFIQFNLFNAENGLYTYYDLQGKKAISIEHQCQNYAFAGNFSEGLAYVMLNDSTWAYLNTKAEIVLKGSSNFFDPLDHSFYHNWAISPYAEHSSYEAFAPAYINSKGKEYRPDVPFKIEELGTFQEGYAFAFLDSNTSEIILNAWVIHEDGSYYPCEVPLSNSSPVTRVANYIFSEGLAKVQYFTQESSFGISEGYLNPQGQLQISGSDIQAKLKTRGHLSSEGFSLQLGHFHKGRALIKLEDYSAKQSQYFYINPQGDILLASPKF